MFTVTKGEVIAEFNVSTKVEALRSALKLGIGTPFLLNGTEYVRDYDLLIDYATIQSTIKYIEMCPDLYNQSDWCGTSCCIIGHARRILGIPRRPEGFTLEEKDSPYRQLLCQLSWQSSPKVLGFIKAIGEDGVIRAQGLDFRDDYIRSIVFKGASLIDCDFTNTCFDNVIFRDCDLTGSKFDGCICNSSDFIRCVR